MSEQLQKLSNGGGGPKNAFSKWIGGRANRKNYWIWVTPIMATAIALGAAGVPGGELALGLPLLFVWIRRFHDLGRTGWWAPAINVVISIIGWIEMGVSSPGGDGGLFQGLLSVGALIVLGVLPGQARDNAYGPSAGHKATLGETFA